jgi:putative ATP-dependent endonuclease of the OLD family
MTGAGTWVRRGLTARAARLVSAPGESGGKDNMPRLARLAASMGFPVRAILDDDKPGESDDLFDEMEVLCELLVILPERTAVERALVTGLAPDRIRETLGWLAGEYGLEVDVDSISDERALQSTAVRSLKMKGGLHKPWVDGLGQGPAPPIAFAALKHVCGGGVGRVVLSEPA